MGSDTLPVGPQRRRHCPVWVLHLPFKQYDWPFPHSIPFFLYTSDGQYSDSPLQNSGRSHSSYDPRHSVARGLSTQAWVSQHFPVAHTAPAVSLQVLASQHLVLQSSCSPQSHSSPSSTNPFPQTGPSYNFSGLFLKQ